MIFLKSINKIMRYSIINNNTGEQIASIKDIIFSEKKLRVLAFVISEGGIFKDEKIIRYENISNIGKDFVSIDKDNIIEKLKDFPSLEDINEKQNKLLGLKVIIEDKEVLGYINDIIFDEKSGNITGFYLTDGIIQDILEGRNTIPYMEDMIITEEAVIINKKFKDEYEKNKENYKKLPDLDL